jgi:hypothetical protein
MEAFQYTGHYLGNRPSELEIVDFILGHFREEALETPDGPIVVVDHHGNDHTISPSGTQRC